MTQDQISLANLIAGTKDPAVLLSLAALIAASAEARGETARAASISKSFQTYRDHAEEALHLLQESPLAAEGDEARAFFQQGADYLKEHFMNTLTPGEKAALTTRRRREAKEARAREERADRETARQVCRAVLNDPAADPADRLDAARRLGV